MEVEQSLRPSQVKEVDYYELALFYYIFGTVNMLGSKNLSNVSLIIYRGNYILFTWNYSLQRRV